jgi:hypothetical protein
MLRREERPTESPQASPRRTRTWGDVVLSYRLFALALCLLVAPISASAEEESRIEQMFPQDSLLPSEADAILTADFLGPPATRYDAQTRPEAVAPQVAATEALVFGKHAERLEAPHSLRCFGRLMHKLSRAGRPTNPQRMFVAEHCGLSSVPYAGA